MTASPELEREVRQTLRLVRWIIYAGIGLAALFLVTGIGGLVFAFAGGGSSSGGDGSDVHTPLRQGATLEITTEAGHQVNATIRQLTWAQGPQVVVAIKGGEPVSTALDRWTLYLSDDTQLAMTGQAVGGGEYRFALDGTIPGGRSVRFVHFNPDDSHGDMYFDAE